jgi:nicotinamide-nucleotide amidase
MPPAVTSLALGSLENRVLRLATILQNKQWLLSTAESCTGGLIAATCTELAGSSLWFERGFVSYSNAAKTELLGVPAELISQYGAVSQSVVQAMVQGALARSQAQVAVAVTGIAGPSGGSPEKPVGTVWFGWAWPGHIQTTMQCFPGDRTAVRCATVEHALSSLIKLLSQ